MKKLFAFTLAEILIAITIIGIVALLTIPNLVQNFKQHSWDTSAVIFERKLEEALKVMNAQQTLAGYSTTEDFVNELSKHIKITKICKNSDLKSCFEEKVYWGAGDITPVEVDMSKIKEAKNLGQDEWKTKTVGLQFSNGTNAVIAYNPECKQDPYSNQITGINCLAILYDITAYKNPNTSGKDLRGINVKKLGSTCAIELDGICFSTATKITESMTISECLELKDKLGIDLGTPNGCCYEDGHGAGYCNNHDFYWGTAVKVCGGVEHMPSDQQLNALGKYLYDNKDFVLLSETLLIEQGITTEEQMQALIKKQLDADWNNEKVTTLGILPIVESSMGISYFQIYGNRADSTYYDLATFSKKGGGVSMYDNRQASKYAGIYAVCVD